MAVLHLPKKINDESTDDCIDKKKQYFKTILFNQRKKINHKVLFGRYVSTSKTQKSETKIQMTVY